MAQAIDELRVSGADGAGVLQGLVVRPHRPAIRLPLGHCDVGCGCAVHGGLLRGEAADAPIRRLQGYPHAPGGLCADDHHRLPHPTQGPQVLHPVDGADALLRRGGRASRAAHRGGSGQQLPTPPRPCPEGADGHILAGPRGFRDRADGGQHRACDVGVAGAPPAAGGAVSGVLGDVSVQDVHHEPPPAPRRCRRGWSWLTRAGRWVLGCHEREWTRMNGT
mmetsp:Transcript_28737/g.71727  ORF Transcript_28737/g.71727 Transcript_28737/m.71727 type:complete len:221 (+) Transcript_28737:793-1455(+)